MDQTQPVAPKTIQYPKNYSEKRIKETTENLTNTFGSFSADGSISTESIRLMQEKINNHEVTFGEAFKAHFPGFASDDRITQFKTALKVIACFAVFPLIGFLFDAAYNQYSANTNFRAYTQLTKNFTTSFILDPNYSYQKLSEEDEVPKNILVAAPKYTNAQIKLQEAGDAWTKSIVDLMVEMDIAPEEVGAFFAACATHLMLLNTTFHSTLGAHRHTISDLAVKAASYALDERGQELAKAGFEKIAKRAFERVVNNIANSTDGKSAFENLNESNIDAHVLFICKFEGNETPERFIAVKNEIYKKIKENINIKRIEASLVQEIKALRNPDVARIEFFTKHEGYKFIALVEAKLQLLNKEVVELNTELQALLNAQNAFLEIENASQNDLDKLAKLEKEIEAKQALLDNKLTVIHFLNKDLENAYTTASADFQEKFMLFYSARIKKSAKLEKQLNHIASSTHPELDVNGNLTKYNFANFYQLPALSYQKIDFRSDAVMSVILETLLGDGSIERQGAPCLLNMFLNWFGKVDLCKSLISQENGKFVFTENAVKMRVHLEQKSWVLVNPKNAVLTPAVARPVGDGRDGDNLQSPSKPVVSQNQREAPDENEGLPPLVPTLQNDLP